MGALPDHSSIRRVRLLLSLQVLVLCLATGLPRAAEAEVDHKAAIIANAAAVAYLEHDSFLAWKTYQTSGSLVHLASDGRTGLVLASHHGSVGRGDLLLFCPPGRGSEFARVRSVVSKSKTLDYRLLRIEFERPTRIKPIELDLNLPGCQAAYSVGYSDKQRHLRAGTQLLPRGKIVRARLSGPALFRPRVKGVTFSIVSRSGESGGPIFDGVSHKAVAVLCGGSAKDTLGVPVNFIVADALRKSQRMTRRPFSWLRTPSSRRNRALIKSWTAALERSLK